MTWLDWYVVVIVHLGCVPAVGYPLVWRFARPAWAESRVGRALMRKAEALGLLFAVSVARVWLPGGWWDPVYALLVTYVVVTLFRQFWVLLSVLREGRVHGVSD